MKMNKFVAMLMAVLMLCCIVPFSAMADGAAATISFNDLAYRTSCDNDQQVWQQNGITVTNDKAASTSNVNGQYYGPVRFYKNSDVTVEYPGMTLIEFTCNSASYANTLASCIEGAVVNGAVVSVTLDGADSFTCSMTAGQVRVDSIAVYVEGGAPVNPPVEPDEPEVPSDPAADSKLTIEEAIALGSSKEHNTYTEGKYYVTGVITEVYQTVYGNMKLTDEAGNILTIYGTYSADGATRYDAMDVQPVAGDTVTIYGIVGQYNGTPQIKNGWIVEHTAAGGETPDVPVEPDVPSDPAADSVLTIPQANELGLSKENNTYTEGKYYVTGKIVAISNSTYGNMYIVDENNNQLMIYGTYSADGEIRYDALEYIPVVGDTITVYGIIGTYNGTEAQMKNGWITEIVKGDGEPENTDPAADSVLTVKEAIELGLSKLHNVFTENKYYVTAEITEIYNDIYGNMYVKDAEGNVLTVYGSYDADGTNRFDAMETKPVVGDTVKLYGIIGQYNSNPQMKNAWIIEINPTDEPVTPGEPDVPVDPETPDEPGTDSPVTGDNTTVYVTLAVVLMALAAAAAFITSKKRA